MSQRVWQVESRESERREKRQDTNKSAIVLYLRGVEKGSTESLGYFEHSAMKAHGGNLLPASGSTCYPGILNFVQYAVWCLGRIPSGPVGCPWSAYSIEQTSYEGRDRRARRSKYEVD